MNLPAKKIIFGTLLMAIIFVGVFAPIAITIDGHITASAQTVHAAVLDSVGDSFVDAFKSFLATFFGARFVVHFI